jgi:hypothetical protein
MEGQFVRNTKSEDGDLVVEKTPGGGATKIDVSEYQLNRFRWSCLG